jgi:hypothetical protein
VGLDGEQAGVGLCGALTRDSWTRHGPPFARPLLAEVPFVPAGKVVDTPLFQASQCA